jgi:AraC-like DNA-binding protein
MGKNVLLVLSNENELAVLTKKLQGECHVVMATNVEELLQLLDTTAGQIVICGVAGTTGMDETGCNGKFVKKLQEYINRNVHNHSLNVDGLARHMNMSRPTFYRKIKSITGFTPNDLINQVRLKKAARLLEAYDYRINEIARMTGFHSQSSFGKAFIKQFKVTPTEYQRLKRRTQNPVKTGLQEKHLLNFDNRVYNY